MAQLEDEVERIRDSGPSVKHFSYYRAMANARREVPREVQGLAEPAQSASAEDGEDTGPAEERGAAMEIDATASTGEAEMSMGADTGAGTEAVTRVEDTEDTGPAEERGAAMEIDAAVITGEAETGSEPEPEAPEMEIDGGDRAEAETEAGAGTETGTHTIQESGARLDATVYEWMKPGVFGNPKKKEKGGPWDIPSWRSRLGEHEKLGEHIKRVPKEMALKIDVLGNYGKWSDSTKAKWDRAVSGFVAIGDEEKALRAATQEYRKIVNPKHGRGSDKKMWIMVLLLSHEYNIPVPEEMKLHPDRGEATKHFMRVYMDQAV